MGNLIDNIESNISSIAVDTSGAAEELTTASEYQRRAGRRAACLMIIMVIVVCVVLVAVSQLLYNAHYNLVFSTSCSIPRSVLFPARSPNPFAPSPERPAPICPHLIALFASIPHPHFASRAPRFCLLTIDHTFVRLPLVGRITLTPFLLT